MQIQYNITRIEEWCKSHDMPVYFAETPAQEMEDIVAINVNATLRVTHAILPGMVQRYVSV